MADRFWRGGAGTWNSSNTANWSTTSGGSGGASVPSAADDVYFDSNSGTGTCTISGTVNCRGMARGASSIVFNGTSSPVIRAYGDVFLQEDLDNITLRMYGASASLTMNGYPIFALIVEAGATVDCAFALDIVDFVSVAAGGTLELAAGVASTIPTLTLAAGGYLRSNSIGSQALIDLTNAAVLYGSVRDIEVQSGVAYFGPGSVNEGNNENIRRLGAAMFGLGSDF